MKGRVHQAQIAQRIRGLLGADEAADYEFASRRLGVSEVSLRMSVDELEPHPTLEVLAALVREYGVDPNWLLTGIYDSGGHRAALEDSDENRIARAITDLLAAAKRDEFFDEGRQEA